MNRGKRNWTRNKFERYIREGRGQGQGESYKPWITIQDFRTVKPAKDLEKKSVVNKLELERRYYASQNIDWGIVTEKEIPRLLAENIEWIHAAYRLEPTAEMNVLELRSLFNILKFRLSKSNGTINQVTTALDREMNIEPGTSLYLFKHLLARKEILMDMLTQKVSGCPSTQAILGNSFN